MEVVKENAVQRGSSVFIPRRVCLPRSVVQINNKSNHDSIVDTYVISFCNLHSGELCLRIDESFANFIGTRLNVNWKSI